MPKSNKRMLIGKGKGYLSAAGSQYRFIVFLVVILGVYTFLLKVFQKIAEIVELPVFLPLALTILLFFIGVVGTLYSHSFVGPVLRIRKVLDQLAEGETHVSLRLRDSDEPLLKELVQSITRLCENSRNSRALIRESAEDLLSDISKLQERMKSGADAAELQSLIEGLRTKQEILEKALKTHEKA